MTAAGFLKLFCTVLNGSTSGLYIVFGAFTNYHIINKALVIVIITFLVSSVKHKAQITYGSTTTGSTHTMQGWAQTNANHPAFLIEIMQTSRLDGEPIETKQAIYPVVLA